MLFQATTRQVYETRENSTGGKYIINDGPEMGIFFIRGQDEGKDLMSGSVKIDLDQSFGVMPPSPSADAAGSLAQHDSTDVFYSFHHRQGSCQIQ